MMNRRDFLGVASLAMLSPGAALAAGTNAAETAVEAAKKYAGTEISIVWEAGLQSLDPLNYSGPKWEQLTGIKVKVVEVPTDQMFTKIVQDFRSGAGAYDALNVIPSWMPDLVKAGALEPLDAFVDQFGYRDELQDIAPAYRDNQMMVDGKIYGFPDDGDVMLLYYRKDIFDDPKMKEEFKAKHGYDLAPPTDWKQFAEIGQFITDKMAPKTYGAGFFRAPPYTHYMFQERFRIEELAAFHAEAFLEHVVRIGSGAEEAGAIGLGRHLVGDELADFGELLPVGGRRKVISVLGLELLHHLRVLEDVLAIIE